MRTKEENELRTRTEEINVRVSPAEKRLITRRARHCGMNTSAYLRALGVGQPVRAAPPAEIREVCLQLAKLREEVKAEPRLAERCDALSALLLKVCFGEENDDGRHEDLVRA